MQTHLAALLMTATLAAASQAAGWGRWDQYPDLSYAPDPAAAPGWSRQQLDEVWQPLSGFEASPEAATMRADAAALRLHPGQRLLVYYRDAAGARQGLAGNAEVLEVDAQGQARLKVRLSHLMTWFEHDPWRGWQRRASWRPGYAPGQVGYFLSRRELVWREPGELDAIRDGVPYRGMWAADAVRAWGAPSARGRRDFPRGPQEQWVYQVDPFRRAYLYVDVASQRVTGWHGGQVQ